MSNKAEDLGTALRCSALQSIRLAWHTKSLSKEDAVIQTQTELGRIERATNSLMSSIVAEIKEHWGFLLELVELSLAADDPFGNFDGRELRVPSQYPTLRAAVEEAKDGDTILMAPGLHREEGKIVVASAVQIDAEGGEANARAVTIDISWGCLVFDQVNDKACALMRNVTLQNVGNPVPGEQSGDLVCAPAMVEARFGRLTLENCHLVTVSGGATTAFMVSPDASAVLIRNKFTATVDCRGVCTMDNNVVEGCSGNGIMVTGEKVDPITGNAMSTVLNYNTIANCKGVGIWLRRRAFISSRVNLITGCGDDGLLVEDARTQVMFRNSKIEQCGGRGVAVCGGPVLDLDDVFVQGCGKGGVEVVGGDGASVTLSKCSVLANGSHGVAVGGTECVLRMESVAVKANGKACVSITDTVCDVHMQDCFMETPGQHPYEWIDTVPKANYYETNVQFTRDAVVRGGGGGQKKEQTFGPTEAAAPDAAAAAAVASPSEGGASN